MGFVDNVRALLPGRKAPPSSVDQSSRSSASTSRTKAKAADGAPHPGPGTPGSLVTLQDPAWAQPAPKVGRGTEIGTAGTQVRGGRIQREEWNPKLENEKGYGDNWSQGVYDEMRKTDPQIRRALQLLKLPILAARWLLEPASTSDLDKEIADFIAYCLFERLTWSSLLRQSLLMYDFGAQLFEVLEAPADVPRGRFPNLPHDKGPGRPGLNETVTAAVWSSIEPRPMRTIFRWVPRSDRPTMLKEIVQHAPGSDVQGAGFVTIPADRLLRFTHEQEGGNFAGTSVLRYVYKPWRMLDILERIEIVRHERQNIGTPVMTLPAEGAVGDDVDKAEKILRTIGSSERNYIVEPPGWKFRWETSGEGSGTNVGEAIERCIRAIADAMLAGFMALGNGDTGSYALADTQADMYLLSIEAGAKAVEEAWNKGNDGWSPIERLVRLNYGPQAKYPRLKVVDLKSRDYSQILPIVAEFFRYGAIRPSQALENLILQKLDLPPITPEDEEVEDDVVENPDKELDDAEQAAPGKAATPPVGAPATPAPRPSPATAPAPAPQQTPGGPA